MFLPGTGPIHPADRTALLNVISSPSLTVAVVGTGRNGGTREWLDLLANPTSDPCVDRVYGLWCLNGRVMQLSCLACGWSGVLPPAIGGLSELRWLEFSQGNALSGPLPCELGQLTKLMLLQVDSNRLTALTPCLGALTQLYVLTASNNALTAVPDALAGCVALRTLDLKLNQLSYLNASLFTGSNPSPPVSL